MCDLLALRIFRRTYVPGLPLIRAVDTLLDLPAIDLPFTAVIRSPGRIPARFAGESSNTPATSRPRGRSTTVMPTPEN